jgi:hypothetical protein
MHADHEAIRISDDAFSVVLLSWNITHAKETIMVGFFA